MNTTKVLNKLKLKEEDFITVMYSDEGEYYRLDLETTEGFCYSVDVMKEDTV